MKKIPFKVYFKDRIKNLPFTVMIILFLLFSLGSAIYFATMLPERLRDFFLCIGMPLFVLALFPVEYLIGFKCGNILVFVIIVAVVGGIIGPCYNIYSIIPASDVIVHAITGVLLYCLGYMLAEKLFGTEQGAKPFFARVLFSVAFCFMIGVLWEFVEFLAVETMHFDMLQDTYVDKIESYLLAGNQTDPVILENITETWVFYNGGADKYVITNGYLDIGIYDTMYDLLIATLGTVVGVLLSVIGYFRFPKLNEELLPHLVDRRVPADIIAISGESSSATPEEASENGFRDSRYAASEGAAEEKTANVAIEDSDENPCNSDTETNISDTES